MSSKANRALASAEAHGLWSRYGFSSPADLVLEDLAMAMGIVVMDGRLDSALARLVRSGNIGIVRVSDQIREPGRRRFAIAHEIGHWQLHRKQSHLLACTDEDMLARYGASPLEAEASAFAGALLMPKDRFIERVNGQRPTRRIITDLCNYFHTTLTATALRYVETTDDYYIFVLSENNHIRWWRASDSFGDRGFWIESRTPVPANSAAAQFFQGKSVPTQPQYVDFRDWLGDVPGVYSDTVVEQAYALPSYRQVISILWLP